MQYLFIKLQGIRQTLTKENLRKYYFNYLSNRILCINGIYHRYIMFCYSVCFNEIKQLFVKVLDDNDMRYLT